MSGFNLKIHSVMKSVICYLFMFVNLVFAGEYHLEVKTVVNTGMGTTQAPVYPSNFDSLEDRKVFTPAEGPQVGMVVFGLRARILDAANNPVMGEVQFTAAPELKLWKNSVSYRSGPIPFFNKSFEQYSGSDPYRTTRPDLFGTNLSGAVTTPDTMNSLLPFNASTFWIADNKFALGTDVDINGNVVASPHPRMSSDLGSGYIIAYTLSGTVKVGADTFTFSITPGHFVRNNLVAQHYYSHASAIVGIPSMTAEKWVAQLEPQPLPKGVLGKMVYKDPSNMAMQPWGYQFEDFRCSTDLLTWFYPSERFTSTNFVSNPFTITLNSQLNEPRLFFTGTAVPTTPF